MDKKTEDIFLKIKFGIRQCLIKEWKGLIWLLKIILPISFATTLLVTFICAKILGITTETGEAIVMGSFAQETKPFMVMLNLCGRGTFKLIVQIFCIIMPLRLPIF